MKKIRNILWGIVLIVVGAVLGCNAMGIINVDIFFDGWWTLFIIVPCLIGLITEREKIGHFIGLLVGIALLLCCRDVLDYGTVWKLAFPTILVLVGISILFKDVLYKKINNEIDKINKSTNSENSEYCAIFSGQDVNFNGEEFKGATLTAMFGGLKCDLRQAIINEDQVLNVKSVFGGVEIHVPGDIKVKIKSSSIFGGVSDSRKNFPEENDNMKVLYINATSMFGGVDIK